MGPSRMRTERRLLNRSFDILSRSSSGSWKRPERSLPRPLGRQDYWEMCQQDGWDEARNGFERLLRSRS